MVSPSTVESLPSLLALQVARHPMGAAFRFRANGGSWTTLTWHQFSTAVAQLTADLERAGVRTGARVGILGANGIAWELSQHAIFALGGTVVGLDPLYPSETLASVMAVCELTGLIVFESSAIGRIPTDAQARIGLVMIVSAAREASGQIAPNLRIVSTNGWLPSGHAPTTSETAIMVFSSGTTGTPKPIVYTHRQVLLAVREILDCFPDLDRRAPLLCWLPLANLFQRVINFCALHESMCSYLLEDPRQVIPALSDVEPEIMIGVPIFFERVRSGMLEKLAAAPPGVRGLASWALESARTMADADPEERRSSFLQRIQHGIAERLVLRRLRRVFGGRIRYLVSGSAPLPEHISVHFRAIGLPILEAYGVSENIVPIAMNRPRAFRPGTVGRVMRPNELRIGTDGEIQVRGPGVFDGYFNADRGTPAPDPDGYWHTGDLGSLDESGFLRIVGRKSDAYKLSTGKWVAPADIESALRVVPWVDHVAAFGAGRKSPVVIISAPALKHGLEAAASSGTEESFLESISKDLAVASQALAGPMRPAGVLVTLSAFSIADGELTSNLKLRRRAIETRYATALSALHSSLDNATAGMSDSDSTSRPLRSTPIVRVLR